MTEKFDSESLSALIAYRIERAEETLKEADFMASGEFFNTAVNRLYYTCYYAASALMIANNYSASTHKGIKVLLNLNFIKKGLLDYKYGAIYQQLFEKRQSGDYEDFMFCDKELYESLRPKAVEFLNKIKEILK